MIYLTTHTQVKDQQRWHTIPEYREIQEQMSNQVIVINILNNVESHYPQKTQNSAGPSQELPKLLQKHIGDSQDPTKVH